VERPGGGDWLRLAETARQRSGDLAERENPADVLLESFRPGVMERLGLGYERLARANPRLVYCSLSGYGPEGPYRERAGHDLNYIGLAGLLYLTGPRGEPPAIPVCPWPT